MSLTVQAVRAWVQASEYCAHDCKVIVAELPYADAEASSDEARDVLIHDEREGHASWVCGVFNTFTRKFDAIFFRKSENPGCPRAVQLLIQKPASFIRKYCDEDQKHDHHVIRDLL